MEFSVGKVEFSPAYPPQRLVLLLLAGVVIFEEKALWASHKKDGPSLLPHVCV